MSSDAGEATARPVVWEVPQARTAWCRTSPPGELETATGLVDVQMADGCEAEVRRLHEFFVEWFNDDREHPRAEFADVDGVLHPDFTMVLPSGETIDRTVALARIRAARASTTGASDVDIEIVDFLALAVAQDAALVSYQERQFSGGVLQNARTSTAYFLAVPDAPHGVQWYRLHETLLAGDSTAVAT